MAQQKSPRLVTVAEIADVMRVSKMTVYRMIHSGELPALRVGKSFRVPEAAVEKLLTGMADWDEQTGSVANG